MSLASVRIRPSIILFGESITEFAFGEGGQVGWASLLSSAYSRRADVLSRGFSGYNTQHALGIMDSIFGNGTALNSDGEDNRSDPKQVTGWTTTPLLFCTVFFGANDASLPTARQHLPIEEYDRNLRKMITKIRKSTYYYVDKNTSITETVPIILFTPPPVSSKAWDHFCTVTSPRPLSPRSNKSAREYGMKVKKIGEEMDCTVVDTFSILGGDRSEDYYSQFLTDGLHLNGQGNTIVFNELMNAIKIHHNRLLPMIDGSENGVQLEEKVWSELC